MTTKKRLAVLLARDDGPAALAGLGYVQITVEGKDAYDKGYARGVAQGMSQARLKITEVADLAEQTHLDTGDLLILIRQGCDVAEARATIQAMQVKGSKKQVDLSSVNPPTPMAAITL